MESFLPLIYIVVWFAIVFGASYLINWLLIRSVIRTFYRFFVAPGVIVHEVSHALGCLIMGAHIVEINFWKPSGGHVKHHQPHVPIVGEAVIALAPIWGTFLILSLLTYFLVPDLIDLSYFVDVSIFHNLPAILDPLAWQTWLYLYLVVSLFATITPSKTDMRYALASLVVFGVVFIALLFVPGFLDWLRMAIQFVMPFAFFIVFLLAIALVIAFLLFLPNRHKRFGVG